MVRRKSRGSLTGSVAVGGCLWRVGSAHSEHYVIAKSAREAEDVYHGIPDVQKATAKDVDATTVLELRRVDTCVFAMPIDLSDETQD